MAPIRIPMSQSLLFLILCGVCLADINDAGSAFRESERQGEFPTDPLEDVKSTPLAAEEFRKLKLAAMPMAVAQEHFHQHFPPWSAQEAGRCLGPCQSKAQEAPHGTSENVTEWSRRLGASKPRGRGAAPARLTRFVRAVGDAFSPMPAVGACLNLQIDLASLGIPGVILSLGIEGDLKYSLCDKCFSWNFQAILGFNVGVTVLGKGVYFSMTLTGQLNLKELTCDFAKSSNFCRYLHMVLPEYINRMLNRDKRCHSDSPFEIITAFVQYKYAALRNWINDKFYGDENTKYATSPLALQFAWIKQGLLKYPALFRKAPANTALVVAIPPPKNKTKFSFVAGAFNSASCPVGSANVNSEADCIAAAKSLGNQWGGVASHTDAPRGCYEYDCGWLCNNINFNPDPKGGLHVWTRPICLRVPKNDGLDVQYPTEVTISGNRHYIWIVSFERRLCWHTNYPSNTQGDDRGFDDMAALHTQCKNSLTVGNLPQNLDEILLASRIVTVPTQRDRKAPLAVTFSSDKSAQAWRKNLLRFVATTRSKPRTVLVGKCMRAQLQSLNEPYCALQVPGQWWASSYRSFSTATPTWGKNGEGEGVGLRIDAADVDKGSATITVRIHDMSAGVRESTYKYALAWSDTDPLFQYIGQARVSVCNTPRQTKWQVISAIKGCYQSDGVAYEAWRLWPGPDGLAACKRMCEDLPACVAVDYQSSDGMCSIFNTACTTPAFAGATASYSSHRLVELGCDAVHIPGAAAVKIEKQLWRRKDHGAHWNPFMWLKGSEYLDAGKVWLEFEWAEKPKFSKAWRPDNTTTKATAIPGLADAAQAMFAAADSMIAKLPEYATQVSRRLNAFDKNSPQYEDRWLDYATHTGRFMGRWHPRKEKQVASREGFKTTPAPGEDWSCPPPSDAGTSHYMKCELEAQGSATNSWSQYLSKEWLSSLNNKPCKGSDLSDASVDDRVVHVQRAIKESKYSQNTNTTVEFHAETATSLLNLYLRVLQDVQALFSSYFVDDPTWNGDCHSAIPFFNLPYESGLDFTQGQEHLWQVRTQDTDLRQFIEHRAAGLVHQRHNFKMATETNPFCRWKWASGRVLQERRADFVKQDPPINGRDGYATPPEELSSKMFPHLWCIAVEATRGKDLTGPLAGTAFENGTTVRYSSSCQQSRRVTVDNERVSKSWKRYDCEEAVLTRPFMTFFPTFVKQAIGSSSGRGASLDDTGTLGELGTIVEDVLQCAGRISPVMREFPRRSDAISIDELCDNSERHLDMLDEADPDDEDYIDLMNFVKGQTQQGIRVLKNFIDSLKTTAVADNLATDFKRLFSYYDALDSNGTLLTGDAWRAGLDTAVEKLGTEALVLKRIDDSKDKAVWTAWEALDPSQRRVTSLFQLPVQYRTMTELAVGFSSDQANLCAKKLPTSLTFAVRSHAEGQTWLPAQAISHKVCVRGSVTPLPDVKMVVTLEGCWGTQPYLADGTMENTWRLEARALVGESVVTLITGKPGMGGDSLAEQMSTQQQNSGKLSLGNVDDINGNIGWQLVRRVILDPKLLLDSVMSIKYLFTGEANALSFATGVVNKLQASVQHNILYLARDVLQYAYYKSVTLQNAANAAAGAVKALPFYADLDKKKLDILDVAVELQRVEGNNSNGPWTKSFDVHWSSRSSLGGHLSIPSFAALETRISLSSHYDMSEVFNIIFEEHALPQTYYDCCMLCLQAVGPMWCLGGMGNDMHANVPRCLPGNSTSCNGGVAIRNITNCTHQSVGYMSLPKKYRVAGVCSNTSHFAKTTEKVQNDLKTKGVLGISNISKRGPVTQAPTTTTTTTGAVNTVLTGSMKVNVQNPDAFMKDAVAKNAVKEGIADVAKVHPKLISLQVKKGNGQGGRRLGARQLAGIVQVDYNITIPPSDATVDSVGATNNLNSQSVAQMSKVIQAKVIAAKGSGFIMKVDSITSVTRTSELITTTTAGPTTTATGLTTTTAGARTFPPRSERSQKPTTTSTSTSDGRRRLGDLYNSIAFVNDGFRCLPTTIFMTVALVSQCAVAL